MSPSVPGQQGQTQNRPANTCNMPWGHGTRGQTIDTSCPHLSPSVPGQQGQTQNRPANTCNMHWGDGTRGQTIDTSCPHLSRDNRDKLKTDQLTLVICLGETGHGDKLLTHRVPICPHLSRDNRDKLKIDQLTLVIYLGNTGTNLQDIVFLLSRIYHGTKGKLKTCASQL